MMKSRRHRFCNVIVILGILLTACSNDTTSEAIVTQPAQEQEDSSELGQPLNIVATDVTNNTADTMEQYQIQTRLVDYHLLNETTGLAWGLTRNSLRLYLTEDSGVTWLNISPAANVQFTEIPRYGTEVFFLDKNTGWIVRNGQGKNETVVLRTTNGGKEWKISSLPKSENIKGISFISLARGWIMTTSDTSMGKEEKYLYRTEDGGATWIKIMQNTGSPSQSRDTAFSISNRGYIMGMSFVDSLHGFVTVSDLGTSKLYTTIDGGSTWSTVPNFVDNSKMASCTSLTLGSPRMNKNSDNGFIPLSCSKDAETKFNGYFTTDQGSSWQLASFDLNWAKGLNQMLSPVFINNKEGWYLQDSVVYHTLNQGKTWNALPVSATLQQYIETYPIVLKMEFISSKIGWLLLENTDNKRSLLLQTKNGGISWNVL